jgi:hypothetical protein
MQEVSARPSEAPGGADAESRLARLRLNAEELAALRKQGFVSADHRGRARVCYKLRFRHAGRQHVRCLGSDPAVAARVRLELAELQASARLGRELGRRTQEARRALRGVKSSLEPLLAAAGYGFHGLAIRRRKCQQGPHEKQGASPLA